MEVREAITKRRSIRKYQHRPIPAQILLELVNAGRMAPSGRGEHPWIFVIVRERENLLRLSQIVGKNAPFLKEASACIVVASKPSKYYLEDGSAATENILLMATSYQIGSCWIAGDKKEYAEEVKEFLNIPPEYKLVSLISLGYPAEEVCKEKPSLEKIVFWEKASLS